MILGLDVSHWNAPNWADWAARGYKFAWLKCTEGTDFVDPKYVAHRLAAQNAALKTGPYHYFRAAWGGATQAQHFFDNAYNDLLPPAIDVEAINNAGFTKAVFAQRLADCVWKTIELFKRRPVIYTSKSKWEMLVGSAPAIAGQCDLWVANYTSAAAPAMPTDWSDWVAWQYTSTPLDQNRMKDAFWNSLVGNPPETVTVTIRRSTADDLKGALP
jgi:GH25 family lysozyme M1 (1,4-beta-N-acetylmuramidase)